MRPRRPKRTPRAVPMSAGALILTVPAAAVAAGITQADAPGAAAAGPLQRPVLTRHELAFGAKLEVRGTAPALAAGGRVALEFKGAGIRHWRSLATATTGRVGRYRLRARVPRSGIVRVAGLASPDASAAAGELHGPPATAASPSAAQYVVVRSALRVADRSRLDRVGRRIQLRGRLLPAVRGRRVRLLAGSGRRWSLLASTRTGRQGRFRLRFRVPLSGAERLRVGFSGDRFSDTASAAAGVLRPLVPAVVSWYYDAGNTACGFHARFGVANRTLPCGTRVTFRYGDRQVTATVDDRGPFVAGREYDLDQTTAAALRMGGVATVLASL
jgi:peptidoglycan lytic transglycosylase